MSNKNKNRPTLSFKGSHDLLTTLDNIAAKRGTVRSDVLETLVTEALEGQIQKKPTPDIFVNADKDKPLGKNPSTKAKKTPPDKEGDFWAWFPDMFGSPEKKGPVGKAVNKIIDRAIEDPDKFAADVVKARKATRLLISLGVLGAAMTPILLKRLDAMKEAKAAGGSTVAPATFESNPMVKTGTSASDPASSAPDKNENAMAKLVADAMKGIE